LGQISTKKTKTVKKIGRIILSLNNGNMIDISLGVVLKINLILELIK